jgi:hypothetical protein
MWSDNKMPLFVFSLKKNDFSLSMKMGEINVNEKCGLPLSVSADQGGDLSCFQS